MDLNFQPAALGRTLLALAFVWLEVATAVAESGWFHRGWQADDGLPGNNVSGVVQTAEGWLWVATHSGLVKFDGVKFRDVPLPIPSGRSHPLIRFLLHGHHKDLWLALEGGLVVHLSAKATNVFTASDGLLLFKPMALAQTRDEAVWLSYVDGSVCRIGNGMITRFTAREGLGGVGACWVANDLDGRLWYAKAGQVGTWRGERFEPLHSLPAGTTRMAAARDGGMWICAGLRLLKCASLTKAPVEIGEVPSDRAGTEPSVMFEDRAGRLWIGTLVGGLFLYDGVRIARIGTSHADILALTEDREHNLWAGTAGGGLNRVRPRLLELQDANEGLPLATIRSVCQSPEGTMWAVAQNGELARRDGEGWNVLSADDGWAGVKANCVVGDQQGGVWVGTYHAGLHHWDSRAWRNLQRADGLAGDSIRGLFQDSQTNLWLALESTTCAQRYRDGQFQTYEQPPGSRAIRALAEDAQGNVWFGTLDGYLLRAEGDRLVNETSRTLGAPKPIRCLVTTPDGSLWIGYAGAGLGRLRNGRFQQVSTGQGLHDSYLCALVPDDGGNWWFGSDRGLFQIRQRELEAVFEGKASAVRAVVYGRDEAFPNLQANYGYSPGFARSRDGRIWMPMKTGLAVIDPTRMPPNRLPPPVLIEQVALDGKSLPFTMDKPLRLPPGHRKLEVEFTAFSFIAPEGATFRCRLDGWDEDWVNIHTQRHVGYPRLPAGEYQFRVAARGNAGDWNMTEAVLSLVVEQFIWQTWWFRTGSLALFMLVVGTMVRYVSQRRLRRQLRRLEQETALERERGRIAKDIHDDLGASLTQISLLGKLAEQDLREPERALDHVRQITATARAGVKAVDEIVWAVNPRNDTVAHLLDYAGQFAVDFLRAAGIRCRIDFPEQIPHHLLTAEVRHSLFLVIKEALNNIVKHAQADEVRVRVQCAGGWLHLFIEDNGHGFAAAPENGLSDGLRNMQQRLSEIGGHCRVESRPGGGTRVLAEVPLARLPGSNGGNAFQS